MSRQARSLKASFTVEMSVIVPLALFLVMAAVLVIFYYHDKNTYYIQNQ